MDVKLIIEASLAGTIALLISACQTSSEAWTKIKVTFANRSNTRMLTLLSTLMKTTQEGISIAEYMQSIKTIIDDLALIGHPLSDAEVIAYTLNGLSSDYKEINVVICTRETAITFEELHDKLLDHETFIKC